MCGIYGVLGRQPLPAGAQEQAARMDCALAHRGPDGSGLFQHPHLLLGMRRLAIIDVTGGQQPLYNEDRSLVLVANGEIYNYIELRQSLVERGHRFATGSDCETILHLYEEKGPDCLVFLRGMFAFALWDGPRRRLFLARDRLGEKPLYLHETANGLLFASEIKAFLRTGLVPLELDPAAVHLYFHYQYVPEPLCPVRGIRKLPAGHFRLVDVDPWNVVERRYWRMEDAPALTGDPVETIREELETVSRLVIRSDVPVGVALSGGLDSSAVTALAARAYPGTMRAFSVGYAGRPPCDEREEARQLADYLGLPFAEVELETDEMVNAFPQLVMWRDDPIADIAGYGYYRVMKLAREHGVPVVLQGQGGDELFWGYSWVRRAAQESQEKDALLRGGSGAVLALLRAACPAGVRPGHWRDWLCDGFGLATAWRRCARYRREPPDQLVFYDLAPDFQDTRLSVRALYTPAFALAVRETNPCALFTLPRPWSAVETVIPRLIVETYLLENGIAQGDRLSMTSSIELRLPLLDYRLVETVVGLRKGSSDLRLGPKAWLRAAVRPFLPDWVLRRRKRGFSPPIRDWHRALFARYGCWLCNGQLVERGVLTAEKAVELAEGPYPSGAVAPLSFKALVLETWCRVMSGE